MDGWLVFAVFLYFVAAMLIVTEVFVPSGGLISIAALACVAGALAIFFNHGKQAGLIGVGTAAIMIPTVIIIAYKIFPKTKFGKSVILIPPDRTAGDAIADTRQLKELLGSTGIVTTDLRPVGTCEFDGKRIECVAESGFIDKGKKITVIKFESTQLTVRETDKT